MSHPAAVAAPAHHSVAAVLDLNDPNDRRLHDCLLAYFDGHDRLHAIRRGIVPGPHGPVRMAWMLGSFHPARRGAPVEWKVIYWLVDEIAVRFQHCPDEATARAVYASATIPDSDLPGLTFRKQKSSR